MLSREDLYTASIKIIRDHQNRNGSYIASPNFSEYRYSWLRDGSFIGYGMLKSGNADSTEAFLRWTGSTIIRNQPHWDTLKQEIRVGGVLSQKAHMPTRFTLDGKVTGTDWPEFQIDGYGAWLWLLDEWCSQQGRPVPEWAAPAVKITLDYLALTWDVPNYDAWEEHGDKVHPATLSCVYAGMNRMKARGFSVQINPEVIRDLALSAPTDDGTVPKYLGSNEVDASLLWCAVPFQMVRTDEPVMIRTLQKIEKDLLRDGGVHRYAADTYYGGGRWILLTAWLGWYYLRVGRTEEAEHCASWIEAQAGESGSLPEQVTDRPIEPKMVASWINRWGEVANPLLWSHGMYLVLASELRKYAGGVGEKKLDRGGIYETANNRPGNDGAAGNRIRLGPWSG